MLAKKEIRSLLELLAIAIIAVIAALNYQIFVFPNSFAPAGLDGICTMVRYLLHLDFGYLALICNVPLLIASYFLLSPDFTRKTGVYVLTFSLATLVFENVDLGFLYYHTDTGTSIVLAPIAAGVIRGILYAFTLKHHATSGGTDIIASLILRKHPDFHFMNIVFALNATVAILAYFVYGFKMEPVICSILYSFLASNVSQKYSTRIEKFHPLFKLSQQKTVKPLQG